MRTANENQEEDTWGAIGIGAMIVFISLILVAAVASAVIIQTAEKLQQNAQRAGDDTADELSGKVTIMQGFIDAAGTGYDLYIRLAPGSSQLVTTTLSWQMYCNAGTGYDTAQLAAGNAQLQSVAPYGAGVSPLLPQFAYKIAITGMAACTVAAVGALGNPVAQLFIHVESGGTTYETLTLSNAAAGQPVI